MNRRIRGTAGAVALCGALLLGACTATDPTPTSSPTPTAPPTATPTPTPTATDTPGAVELPTYDNISCDTMLAPEVDARLRAEPLVPYPKPFEQNAYGTSPTGPGIACPWGPPNSPGGMAYAYYTWAAFLPGEREAYLASATQHGHTTEPAESGVWVISDDESGGPVGALFVSETWVAYAPSREQIADIVWTH